MRLYGLLGFTHGWARVMTVMSPEGGARVRAALGDPDGAVVQEGEGPLVRVFERRGGALRQLAERHCIELLERPQWEARKREIEAAWDP